MRGVKLVLDGYWKGWEYQLKNYAEEGWIVSGVGQSKKNPKDEENSENYGYCEK